MENVETKLVDTASSGTVAVDSKRVIILEAFKDEFDFLKSDFYYLMSRVTQLENENRKLKEEKENFRWELDNQKNMVSSLNAMYNSCFDKLDDVKKYVGEMSKDYISNYAINTVVTE